MAQRKPVGAEKELMDWANDPFSSANEEINPITRQQTARRSHNWKLVPGWKQFYYCTTCGVNDVHPKADEPCQA